MREVCLLSYGRNTPCWWNCKTYCKRRLAGVRSGGGSFYPVDLPNLAAWYPYRTGVTASAGLVSQWSDQSGNGNHLVQATEANRPTIESDWSITFNGTSSQMEATFTHNQPVTWYLLFNQVTWSINDRIFDGSAGAVQAIQSSASPRIAVNAGSTVSNDGFPVGSYCVLSAVFNGASSALQVNTSAAATGDAGAINPGGFSLGATRAVGSFANIQVKEVVLYSAAHDAATREKVVNYLRAVGGL